MGLSVPAVVLFLIALACPALARSQSDHMPEAKALVAAMNTKDRAKLGAFLTTSFSPAAGPTDELADGLLGIAKRSAPFEVGELVSQSETEVIFRMTGRQALELEVKIDFDSGDHKM